MNMVRVVYNVCVIEAINRNENNEMNEIVLVVMIIALINFIWMNIEECRH